MNVRNPMAELLQHDPRYPMEAYHFVREGLTYAQDVLRLGSNVAGADAKPESAERPESEEEASESGTENHISGQQLCEAIREYAIDQYGYMAQVVLKKWGITSTSDFGEIVFNLIEAQLMKKSENDQRSDFDDVYSFDEAFNQRFDFRGAEE